MSLLFFRSSGIGQKSIGVLVCWREKSCHGIWFQFTSLCQRWINKGIFHRRVCARIDIKATNEALCAFLEHQFRKLEKRFNCHRNWCYWNSAINFVEFCGSVWLLLQWQPVMMFRLFNWVVLISNVYET